MWFRKKPWEARLDRELRYHFDCLVRDFTADGMPPAEARRRARLEFGGMEQIKEDCRDVRGRWLEDFAKDLRYAARMLRRSPGFLSVSVLSLALGIGANTAVFSLINALMLRSLPVKDPQRLVETTRVSPDGKPRDVSYPLFEYFRDHLKSISGAAAEMESTPAIVMDGVEEIVNAELVTGEHYPVLGVEPAAGRLLGPRDDVLSPAAPAAVIGYRYWQRRFGGSPAAVGKRFTLQIKNRVFTIVGITPKHYFGTRVGEDPDMTLPLSMMLSDTARREPTDNMFDMIARLRPGVTLPQANAEIQVAWQTFLKPVVATLPEKDRPRILRQRAAVIGARNGLSMLRDDYSAALFVLMGIVGLVLLLACANLSGLLLARAASRQREISIRLAIGAGAGRLMRQFLTESFLLAAIGGGVGLLLAGWFSRALVAMLPGSRTLLLSTAPDGRVLAFTGAVALLSCMLAGMAPGWHAMRANLNPGLKQTRAGAHRGLGKTLVVAQLSISMVLVVGAALFVETLVNLYRVDRGMRTDRIVVFHIRTSERNGWRWASINRLLDRFNNLPGVASATVADVIPISGSLWERNVQVEGYRFRPDESEDAALNAVAPKYFLTVGTPLVSGREFDTRDTSTSKKVAIVNETFARYFFGVQSPLARRVTSRDVAYEIVGVVKDAKYSDLRQPVLKTMYIPVAQREFEQQPSNYDFLVRVAAGNPMRMVPALEKAVRETDAGLRIRMVRTYTEIVDRTIATERILATLGGFFGILALLVACLGIFGAMAFQVSRRVNEIGLRVALGAGRGGIVVLVLREMAGMLAAGCVLGASVALTLTGLARKILFGVTPAEPGPFALAAAVLAIAALAAAWLPAWRASRIDPMTALRHE